MASLPSFLSFDTDLSLPLFTRLPMSIRLMIIDQIIPIGGTVLVRRPAGNTTGIITQAHPELFGLPADLSVVARNWGFDRYALVCWLENTVFDFGSHLDLMWARNSLRIFSARHPGPPAAMLPPVEFQRHVRSIRCHVHSTVTAGHPAAFGMPSTEPVFGGALAGNALLPFPILNAVGPALVQATMGPHTEVDFYLNHFVASTQPGRALRHVTWIVDSLPMSANVAAASFLRILSRNNVNRILAEFELLGGEQPPEQVVDNFLFWWRPQVERHLV